MMFNRKWKQALIVLTGLYPTVMVFNLSMAPFLKGIGIPAYLSVLIANVFVVITLTWFAVPFITRWIGFYFRENASDHEVRSGVLQASCVFVFCLIFFASLG